MMYFVATTLRRDKADYAGLEATLKALGPWSNRLDNVWLIESELSARRIRDLVKAQLADEDRVFVGQITSNWAGRNMGATFPDWMARRGFGGPA